MTVKNRVVIRRKSSAARAVLGEKETPPAEPRASLRDRLEHWMSVLQQEPTAEERAAQERRAFLLQELNRTVADAPDDVPIRYVIDRLNRHWED